MLLVADGVKEVVTSGSISAVYIEGNAGGGTVLLGTMGTGGFNAFADLVPVVGGQYEIRHGQGKDLYVSLAGSTGAALNVKAHGIS
jgi:hypothetical protein